MTEGERPEQLLRFYGGAKEYILKSEYRGEVEYVNGLRFEDCEPSDFFLEYAFVVISSGMKNQVAMKIFEKFIHAGNDDEKIGHPGKRKAIHKMSLEYLTRFHDLQNASDKLAYLEQLPWIGPVTKYHLARNIGLDVAKPDRHLVRLAERYGYRDAHIMCDFLSKQTGDRIGVVDVILWRYSNIFGTRNTGAEVR